METLTAYMLFDSKSVPLRSALEAMHQWLPDSLRVLCRFLDFLVVFDNFYSDLQPTLQKLVKGWENITKFWSEVELAMHAKRSHCVFNGCLWRSIVIQTVQHWCTLQSELYSLIMSRDYFFKDLDSEGPRSKFNRNTVQQTAERAKNLGLQRHGLCDVIGASCTELEVADRLIMSLARPP